MKMHFLTFRLLVTAALLFFLAGPQAAGATDTTDAYLPVTDSALRDTIVSELARTGESTTGRLNAFQMKGCSSEDQPGLTATIFVVQDRGRPRGEEYPTYVFVSKGSAEPPRLEFWTYAGKSLYQAETASCLPETCLLSAQQGYSDVCLSNPFGRASPDLPGLRKDFWSDLIKLFGL